MNGDIAGQSDRYVYSLNEVIVNVSADSLDTLQLRMTNYLSQALDLALDNFGRSNWDPCYLDSLELVLLRETRNKKAERIHEIGNAIVTDITLANKSVHKLIFHDIERYSKSKTIELINIDNAIYSDSGLFPDITDELTSTILSKNNQQRYTKLWFSVLQSSMISRNLKAINFAHFQKYTNTYKVDTKQTIICEARIRDLLSIYEVNIDFTIEDKYKYMIVYLEPNLLWDYHIPKYCLCDITKSYIIATQHLGLKTL